MSAFSSLFGKAKIDENVQSLLEKSTGPVSRQDLRPRTVVEVPEPEPVVQPLVLPTEETKVTKKRKAKKAKAPEDNEDLEAEYFSKVTASASESRDKELPADQDSQDTPNEDESSEDKPAKAAKAPRAKLLDTKNEELQKAERTVFVGNVNHLVITSKASYKAFKKLFKELGAVELIRFRSISFDEALPRKVAFARKALHDSRDTVNAYVVFKEKEPSLKAQAKLNATVFEDNHIRVDHVAHPSPRDNKRTIFVGNLDFEEKEESLWRYFNEHLDNDVESVRVVRDSKTNLGKGFALVTFKDSLSVNKALFLNDKPMATEDGKKARLLRILRAKAHAKPSVISPNHVSNLKPTRMPKREITDDQKTKLGRAKKLLGKADRSTAGKMVYEGTRASKGQKIAGIKGLKSAQGRAKKPRITKRSSQFKSDKKEFANLK